MRRMTVLLLCLCVLAACGVPFPISYPPYQGTCEDIALAELRPYLGTALPSDFPMWIAETYHVQPEDILVNQEPQGVRQHYMWTAAGEVYYRISGQLTEEGNAAAEYIAVHYGHTGPTGDEVIACLGEPDSYHALYTYGPVEGPQREIILYLFFHDEGIIIDGIKLIFSAELPPPPADGSIRFFSLTAVAPGTAEEILRTIGGGRLQEGARQLIQQLKPWPGSWDDVVVDVDPSLPQ